VSRKAHRCVKLVFEVWCYSPVLTDTALRLRLQRVTCGCGRWIPTHRPRLPYDPIGRWVQRGHAS